MAALTAWRQEPQGAADTVVSGGFPAAPSRLALGRAGRHRRAMAARKSELVEYLEEAFAPLGDVDAARLFGGWQLRSAGRPFAFVVKGSLYFRAEAALRAELAAAGSRPFSYAKASGPVTIGKFMSCLLYTSPSPRD